MDIVQTLLEMMWSEQVKTLSQQNNLSTQQTQSWLSQLIPVILQGIIWSNKTPQQVSALDQALGQHGQELSDLSHIDLQDGLKILGHIFGDKTDTVYQQAWQTLGIDNQQSKGILSYLAPIVMGLLSQTRQNTGVSTQWLLGMMSQQPQSGTTTDAILKGILDKDGDGSYIDDIVQMGIDQLKK
jgi:hypothetical protein